MTGALATAARVVRVALVAVGVAVFGVGLVVAFVPGTAERLPVEAAVGAAIETLGSDYVVVAVLGVAAVALSGLVAASRRVRGIDEATPTVVEGVESGPYPGADLDRRGARFSARFRSDRQTAARHDRHDRRDRLERAAVRATARAEGCSRAVAEQRVAEGTWTDDPVAARYLVDRDHAGGWTGRAALTLRNAVRGDDAFRRTVDAIERTGRESNGAGQRNAPRAGRSDPPKRSRADGGDA
ncbi:hypothetical protein GRS48_10645 [Halorubrum sp. JWXQ-INN 858]|uniref:DUF7269 family protein n=1 Tax=Halorubrum sp. JWXQ-INN 858 TaxID=2690782 RepID=UPI00135AE50D|nr:hypothetical protein [Halorubrum sp. JWXQ-INN 858]MWV65274.1 hypothetical protein [Halorubrum sp. JWXQ-INN 858]